MDFRSHSRRALTGCAALLVLAVAGWSLADGLHTWPYARTVGQQLQAVLRLVCGLLGVAVVVARFWWRRGMRAASVAWALTVAAPAGLSALVWGPPALVGSLLNVIVALLVAWAVIWALRPPQAA